MSREIPWGVLATALVFFSTPSSAGEPIRIDATSNASAQRSFEKMARQPGVRQRELLIAMLKLNMVGAGSAYDVVNRSELQSPSIARSKDRVAGMTAGEIIALAQRRSRVSVGTSGE